MGPRSGSVEAVPPVLYSSKRRKLQRPELAANTLPKSTVANNSLKQATKPAAKSTAKFVPLKLAEIPLPATSTPVVVYSLKGKGAYSEKTPRTPLHNTIYGSK